MCIRDRAGHPALRRAAKQAIDEYGCGSAGSRLLSGDLCLHHELEEKTAAFKGKESALVFNSGYQANVGILSALVSKDDAVFSDRLNHASIIDGIHLSGAKLLRFRHNDPEHLAALLKKERPRYKQALIITETVFSMDGDIPPLAELVRLKHAFNAMLMVDEAHATGIFGRRGSGLVEREGLTEQVDLIMGTFSKALGGFGAYLAGSRMMTDYLINTCRGFIYSTALPPAVIAANIAALGLIEAEPFRRVELLKNADFIRNALQADGRVVRGCSQIIPVVLGDNERTVQAAAYLRDKGYWVLPIRPPTVPQQEARLRFSLTCDHSKSMLERLVHDLNNLFNR
jgi:8-amino-7-oxononanoate synthase